MWLPIVLACAGDPPPTEIRPTSRPATGDTGAPLTGTGDLDARCVPDPGNALRFLCTVQTAEPTDVTIRAWRPEDPDRVRVIRGTSGEELLLWGLRDASTYQWRADAAGRQRTGQLKTGPLPEDVPTTWEIVADDADAQVEGFLVAPSCPISFVQIVDRDGRIVWYQDVSESVQGPNLYIGGIHRTPDGTILMLGGRSDIVEIDLRGQLLLHLERGKHFEQHVHHDVYRHDGLTWALFVQPVIAGKDQYLLDGVYAFDATGLVSQFDTTGSWPLVPHAAAVQGYWSALYPDAIDFSHANALSIDAGGDVIVSFRHLHAVVKFRGGPAAPDFGEPLWTLAGHDTSILWPGDFDLTGEPGVEASFSGQHDAHFAGDGSLLLFDNRFAVGDTARAVRLQVDEGAATAHALEAWDTQSACAIQGSVREVGDHLLVTCPSGGHVFEFAPGRPDPVWQATPRCDNVAAIGVPRAIPWDLWE